MTLDTRILDLAKLQIPINIFEGYQVKGLNISNQSEILSRRAY